MKIFGLILGILVIVFGLGWRFEANDWARYTFWAPKYEQSRRQTYEQTKSYRQGSIQRLNILCSQRKDADQDHKVMLDDVINQEFSEWSIQDVPDYLQGCLSSARK